MGRGVVVALWLGWAPAWAGEDPSVQVDVEGHVVARVVVAASEQEVRTVLSDTEGQLADLSPEILSVQSIRQGNCEEVTRRTKGLFRPLQFRAMRCATDRGWRETLIEGGDFHRYSAEWQVLTTEHGTEVVYRIDTSVNAPVPDSVVRMNLKEAAKNILRALAQKVGKLGSARAAARG